ncbi:MAG: hypothetical protein COW71_06595 [Ignavibacteriales bacterium CG18_big_fil_WC_8_21_14_2_50_31_20]|nr:MAG: hypothetical protein COW71_06595 [Ignavibacteriales bacterium CG18_big_fil_WC_8_21_14_2_50_31_20]
MIVRNTESLVESQEPEIDEITRGKFASKEKIVLEIESVYKTEPNLQKRLLYYTLHITNVLFFVETKQKPLADDTLQNVFEKILKLKRKWYYNKVPDFLKFLRMAIFSYLRNERNKKDNYNYTPIEADEESNTLLIDLITEYIYNYPADKLVNESFEQLVDKCLEELKGDEIAFFVFEEMMEHSKTNIIIAKNLGLDVKDVENAKKRIKLKMAKVIGQK